MISQPHKCKHVVMSAQLNGHDCMSPRRETQDACLLSKLESGNALLLGVMDGHDEDGGTIARYIRDELPTRLEFKLISHHVSKSKNHDNKRGY